MMRTPLSRLLASFAVLALAACQTADIAARDAGATPEISTDEAGLWMQSQRAEDEIKRAGILIRDPELNEYVKGVACKVAAEYCGEVRIYLLESSSFNAFMMPNGALAVFSGLMLRAENEAQLATVLGHEVGHYEENHSLEQHRTLKRTAALMLAGDLATGGLGTLAGILSLQSYSREHERQADNIGFRRLVAAGYDGREAAKIWSNLIAESQASDFKRKQRRVTRSSLLDSHPAPP